MRNTMDSVPYEQREAFAFFFLFITGKASAAEAYWLVCSRMVLCYAIGRLDT